jgi:flagellar hook-associated protein 3 FlgL
MTIASRVDTLSLQKNMVRDINNAQSRLAKLQRQISSGSLANVFADIGTAGKVEQVSSLQASVVKFGKFIENNKVVQGRISATEVAIDQIYDVMDGFRKSLTLKRSSSGDSLDIKQLAQGALGQISNSLNLYFEGRYIFAGTSTNQQPIGDIINESNVINNQNTTSYYQGDDNNIYVNVSDNLVISYNIKANDPAFVNAIAAFHQAIDGQNDNNNDATFAVAMDNLTDALRSVANLKSQLRSNSNTIDQENDSHSTIIRYFNENISDVMDTDETQAVLEAKSNEIVLMAIYQTFAKLSQLSFVHYMK